MRSRPCPASRAPSTSCSKWPEAWLCFFLRKRGLAGADPDCSSSPRKLYPAARIRFASLPAFVGKRKVVAPTRLVFHTPAGLVAVIGSARACETSAPIRMGQLAPRFSPLEGVTRQEQIEPIAGILRRTAAGCVAYAHELRVPERIAHDRLVAG